MGLGAGDPGLALGLRARGTGRRRGAAFYKITAHWRRRAIVARAQQKQPGECLQNLGTPVWTPNSSRELAPG